MHKRLVSHIIENKRKFAILIDESTTISRKTTLIIYMRAVIGTAQKPQTFFFDLIELSSTEADQIYTALLKSLDAHGLSLVILRSLLINVTTDGASVMLGKHSGVCAKLVSEFPDLVIWHCSNHRLELSVHGTVEEVAGTNHFHIFFDKLYCLYHKSPKAQRELEACCRELHDRCLVIGRILNTRWVASSLRTVVAVWKQFEALHNHVSQAAADDARMKRERAQYGGLMTKLRTNEFVLNLGIMRDALEELADVSWQLQKAGMTIARAHTLVNRQVRVFRSMVDKPGKYATETQAAVENKSFQNISLKPGSKADVLINHKQFCATLATNFETRMLTTRASGSQDKATSARSDEYTLLLEAIRLLDPHTWPDDCDIRYGENDIMRLCQRFSINERDTVRGRWC